MDISGLIVQALNGLGAASSLFLISAGLSLIFGVTRIVNFAHGSLFMIGIYVAYSLADYFGDYGFWIALPLATVTVALLGALLEIFILRHVYKAPQLLQLLATFALVLIIKDAALYIWGPEELLGPRAPGLEGAIQIFGRYLPLYDIFLIAVGPVVLTAVWLLFNRTHMGVLIRAATQDREMVAALGVNQAWLFTVVFALGAGLAGLGGALQLPREAATLEIDMIMIGAAFVVVVVGGLGSLPGAYLAAILICEVKALCVWLGVVEILDVTVNFSKMTLLVEFVVMAAVLVLRPWGLLGRRDVALREQGAAEMPLRRAGPRLLAITAAAVIGLILLPLFTPDSPYTTVLMIDILIAVLFAASLHFIMGPAGLHSFGHAAYFGFGAYAAAMLTLNGSFPMEAAIILAPMAAMIGAAIFGWFAVRLSGTYFAMLTLALAQISWAIVFQWDDVTGGSNGLIGVWPAPHFASKQAFYWLTLGVVVLGVYLLRRILFAPLGYGLRASRDSHLRAEAIGINTKRVQWIGFVIAGTFGGLAGAIFAFSKGSVSPEAFGVTRSVDGLVMVLLGGIQNLMGPILGATVFTWIHDEIVRGTEYWRAALGAVILVLVIAFPRGIAGALESAKESWGRRLLQRILGPAGARQIMGESK